MFIAHLERASVWLFCIWHVARSVIFMSSENRKRNTFVTISLYIAYISVSKPTPWAEAGPHGQLASIKMGDKIE